MLYKAFQSFLSLTKNWNHNIIVGASQGLQQPPGGPAVPGDSLEATSNGAGSLGIGFNPNAPSLF